MVYVMRYVYLIDYNISRVDCIIIIIPFSLLSFLLLKNPETTKQSSQYGWPENCYFKRNIKITPMSDFIELMNEGQEYENKYGRDHSNGWLLRYPLKKLLLFQHFILNNPSFLTSELKLKDYCA
jgi:hypothetical protein